MKQGKPWLLPLCTILVIISAAVLPQRLSESRDADYFDSVRIEPALDSLFSPTEDLAKRLELLARWHIGREESDRALVFSKETLPIDMSQRESKDGTGYGLMPHSSNLEQRVLEALHALAEEAPPLGEFFPESMEGLTGERITIYAEDGLVSNFIRFDWKGNDEQIVLILDETMEKVVSLVISSSQLEQETGEDWTWDETCFPDLPDLYLSYLGLTGKERQNSVPEIYRAGIADTNLVYNFFYWGKVGILSIQPDIPTEEVTYDAE